MYASIGKVEDATAKFPGPVVSHKAWESSVWVGADPGQARPDRPFSPTTCYWPGFLRPALPLLARAQDNPSLTLSAHAYECQSAFWRERGGFDRHATDPALFCPRAYLHGVEGGVVRHVRISVTNACMRNRLARQVKRASG